MNFTEADALERLLDTTRTAIAMQRDPRAHAPLTAALERGDYAVEQVYASALDLELGRYVPDPDGVLAFRVHVAGRPIALVEANRIGIYAADEFVFVCEPPDGQPDGQVWER